ncbi:DUF4931 domain-containing protein [Clostridium sp. C8-1-8]|uniref:galactose-1-phosphate uridylyltransferase n=1 Tax=Clostridium sp. C8-1-8 TaxID=2698831 RepID=UPI001371D19F|nr:DUF4931 domain-containing protein [Clostridium sp. C8-1-8]
MNEIRVDKLTGRQVIIATNRSKRPIHNNHKLRIPSDTDMSVHDIKCPFCRGNEEETPIEIYRIGKDPWNVRVVKNKYPTIVEDGEDIKGYHYVVIETLEHNTKLYQYDVEKWRDIFTAYKYTVEKCFEHKEIEFVQIFKNYGVKGGASLEHPHSQIIALNFTPLSRTSKSLGCLVCEEINEELSSKERVIFDNEYYVAYTPYGSYVQNQIRIAWRKHLSSPENVFNNDNIAKVSELMVEVFSIIYQSLGDISLNICYYIKKDNDSLSHFYIDIFPREGFFAGFEMSTQVFINVTSPEEAANKFRQAAAYVHGK